MAVNVNYSICSFRDQIQSGPNPAETASGNSSGWGFRSCRTEGGGTLARVVDPLDTTRQCIRHQLDLAQANNRAQIGCWGEPGTPINNITTHANGVNVAMRMLIPEIINPSAGAVFLSLLDFHAVNADSLGNRWDTRPGWMLYRQGIDANNMKIWDAWHGAGNNDYDSNLSLTPLPIGVWFWLEVYYKFDPVERPIPMWVDGLPFHSTMPRASMMIGQACAQVYSKFYGGGPWAPMTPIRYTGEFLMSNQGRIVTDALVPPVVIPPVVIPPVVIPPVTGRRVSPFEDRRRSPTKWSNG